MQLSTAEAIQIMRHLGIEMKECKHHVRGFFVLDGRALFPVHCSNGRKDMPAHIPHLFRKSLHLSVDEFEVLRKGGLSRDDYIQLLRKKGIV